MISQPWKHQFPHHLQLDSSNRSRLLIGLNILACVLILVGGIGGWRELKNYDNRFLPQTILDGYDLTGLTLEEARSKLTQKYESQPVFSVKLTANDIQVASTSSELGIKRNIDQPLDDLSQQTKSLPIVRKLLAVMEVAPITISTHTTLSWDEKAFTELTTLLRNQADQPDVEATLILRTSGNAESIAASSGKKGRRVDQTALTTVLSSTLSNYRPIANEALTVDVPLSITGQELDESQLNSLQEQARSLVGKRLTLAAPGFKKTLNDQDLITIFGSLKNANQQRTQELMNTLAETVNRPAQDAVFEYDHESLKVTDFKPDLAGLEINIDQLLMEISPELEKVRASDSELTFNMPVVVTPAHKTLSETNNLGIQQLIGFGDSEYDHSIPSRIHNVSLTSQKLNWSIVKPGEQFSFNKALGEVSAQTGYKPAYVIKGGQTVLGDGGGVCQVSTTLFRALLDGGLQITRRRPHSYRVSYYELNQQAGFDATVYSGEVDLRFINDTPGHILISTQADSEDLYMQVQLYGTSDGRTTEIRDYKSWDYRSAPAPVFIPDPSLPPGKKVQVDWATSGIKTSFTTVVKDKDGKPIREDTYTSNYIPWSAKYRQGI